MRRNLLKIKKTDAKFFMGYKDNKKIWPLYIKLPKMNERVISFKETKCMSFEIKKRIIKKTYWNLGYG